ncbi:MAG: hypothetical protein NC218_08965 [Acetobacter sp.]|nr:hypothetical protein [Acetobacter sp.]
MEFNNLPPFTFYGSLISSADIPFMKLYLRWLQLLAIRGIGQKHIHNKTFNYLYRAISREWSDHLLLGKLQKEFIARNLSLSLLLEPLDGFEWLSKNRYILTLTKASPILLQIITPLARLIAILNNQHPPFYQPFSSLIFAYAILYVLNSQQLQEILANSSLQTNSKQLKKQLPLFLNESKQVLSVITGFRFKVKVAYFIAMCRCLIIKNANHTKNNINFLDSVNAFLYGLWYIITIRDNSQGLNKL